MLPPFQSFLDAHRDEVYRFLAAAVGTTDVDDCFQETFIAALRAYPRLPANSNLRPWVLKIAQRKAVDAHRSRLRRPLPVAETPVDEPAPDRDGTSAVWRLARRLPPRQRTAVALRFAGDLPHAEIARVMGCSEEAARRNVHEGLKRLRELWER